MAVCQGGGCVSQAVPGRRYCRLCARVHGESEERGAQGARYESPRQRLRVCALELANVDSEDDAAWKAADQRLAKAAQAWARRGGGD